MKALAIVAHPHLNTSIANKYIVDKLSQIEGLKLHNLYDLYPYFHIDVKAEQALLLNHDLIIFQHPFYWYSVPPLLKMWFDEVLELGFAYGVGGEALKGKSLLVSITAGGSEKAYSLGGDNQWPIEDYMKFYLQTAKLTQMNWLPPHVLHGSRKVSEERLKIHATTLVNRISELCSKEAQ